MKENDSTGRKSRTLVLLLVLASLTISSGWAQAQSECPPPSSVLGFEVGADFKLASYEQSVEYFRQLDSCSDFVQLVQNGRTSEGRPWYMALISAPENLANVEKYRQMAQQLAHPQGLTDEQAHQLARDGKAFVDINGGLHASEVAGAQHTIEFAYELVSRRNEPEIKAILDQVIVLVWPSLNPDGQDIVGDWYRSNLGTPYEVAPMVQLYQKYIGHDNNRDAYMLNMIESRVLAHTWRHWEPQIIYVHHQTAPFPTRIWLPPFAEPIASQTPPLMTRTVNMVGMAIARGLESHGMPGATHMGTGYDAWYPGYVDYLPMMQNRTSFWTETALYRYATPHFYTVNDFPRNDRSLRNETLYPSPWKGGWWHLRDAVDYMVVASLSVVDFAAKYREDLLYDRYQAGRDTIRKYSQDPPYAYFVPQRQHDPVAAPELLRRLAFNGIRIYQLTRPVTLQGMNHPAGTWVIPMDQEFAELARQLLEVQSYPDLREFPEGPPEQPYDAAGWTLPYQMDVKVIEATSPLSEEVRSAMQPLQGKAMTWESGYIDENGANADASPFDSVPGPGFNTDPVAVAITPPAGTLSGSGPNLLIDPAQNNAFRALNRALAAGHQARFQAASEGGSQGGRFLLQGVSGSDQQAWTRELALSAERTDSTQGTPMGTRIALYRPWRASIDEGWTRWLLEQYDFPFSNIRDIDFETNLSERFDVIVLPAENPGALLGGFAKGSVPPRYEGGIGEIGVRALDQFVRGGGTLVCLNEASNFAIDQLHLPIKNAIAGLKREDFFSRGSIFEVSVNTGHPVMAGMPDKAPVFFDRSPVFSTQEGFRGTTLASYAKEGSPLLSGYLLGEKHLQGLAAALDVQLGEGHVILLGFRPQWRGQPFGTFRVLFNSLLFGTQLGHEFRAAESPMKKADGKAPAETAAGAGTKPSGSK